MQIPIEIWLKRLGLSFRGPTAFLPPTPVPPSGKVSVGSHTIEPTGPASRGYPPAPYREAPPRRLEAAATSAHVQQVVERVNQILQGRLNVTLVVTLTANSGTTTVIDARIGAFTSLMFCPMTADAAAEMAGGTLYVSDQKSGQATITHANNAQIDRQFMTVILG